MQSNLSPAPVLSNCPDCERPNYSKTNWCTACGCLLIGYDIPCNQNAFLNVWNSQYASIQNQNFKDSSQINKHSFTNSYNCDSFSDRYNYYSENQNVSEAVKIAQFNSTPLFLAHDFSKTCAYEQNSNEVHQQPNCSHAFASKFRQRCVSGPCEGDFGCKTDSLRTIRNSQPCSNGQSDLNLYSQNQVNSFFQEQHNLIHLSQFPSNPQYFSPFVDQHIDCLLPNLEQFGMSSTQETKNMYNHQPINDNYQQSYASNLSVQQSNVKHFSSGDDLQTNGRYVTSNSRGRGYNRQKYNNRWDRSNNRTNHKKVSSDNKHNQRKINATEHMSADVDEVRGQSETDYQSIPNLCAETDLNCDNTCLHEMPNCVAESVFEQPTSANEPKQTFSWFSLPTEIWFHIIRILAYKDRASLSQTCQRLRALVSDRHVWREIRLDRYQNLTDAGLAAIGRKRPQQLHLTYCRGENITAKGIRQLFNACGKSLEKLSFIGCSKGAFQGDMLLLVSALYCQHLSYIDASYAHTVRDQTVRAIAESSIALKCVRLNGAQNISNSAIDHIVRYHNKSLERLELFGCFRLNSKIFTTLGACHGLKALAFGFLHHLSSTGLLELVSKLPLLSSLDLRGTQRLVTDTSLTRLAIKCPFLEEIVLANMSSLTKEDGVINMLHWLPRLRVLDLCGLTVVSDCTIQALAINCPVLEELDISCTSVTETGLLYLANAPATNLKSLRVSFCHRISLNVLEKLVKCCLKLINLSLYGFSWIEKWEFLLDLRSNLIIQTETKRICAKQMSALPKIANLPDPLACLS